METPQSLMDAITFFDNSDNALQYLASKRWPKGVTCPYCDASEPMFLATRKIWKCRRCRKQFSVKVGTIFEDSPLPLGKWLAATWLISNCKNGVSSYQIARDLKVTQKSAWFMLQRIRLAMQEKDGGMLGGEVEVDETFIGGKARKMHRNVRRVKITGTGGADKAMVQGMVERGGKVRTIVVSNRKKQELQGNVRDHVKAGSAIFSDALKSYKGLSHDFRHDVIDRAVEYANGNVHTNTMENFWSLLKRGLHGTYASVEPFHLFRFLGEQAFRYNHRWEMTDADRFSLVCSRISGRHGMN